MAEEYKSLDATYAISGGMGLDWEHKQGNTHFYLNIKGRPALELFDSLDVVEVIDECVDAPSKTSGNIYCVKDEMLEHTFCSFGIDLKTNQIVLGSIC